jgi:hypothetical protein
MLRATATQVRHSGNIIFLPGSWTDLFAGLWLQSNYNRVLEKLIVAQLIKKLPHFMEPKISIPHSQERATGLYHEPDESSFLSILMLSSNPRLCLRNIISLQVFY